jgi:hypothetical protein
MQWSELMAGAGLLVFLIVLVVAIGTFAWRVKKLEHEERRLMIEKGMMPPPQFGSSWTHVKQREDQLRHEERQLMIEKGMVPPEVTPGKRWELDDYLRGGVITFFLGIGLGITYYLLPESSGSRGFFAFASPALALYGLGCLTYYRLSRDRAKSG